MSLGIGIGLDSWLAETAAATPVSRDLNAASQQYLVSSSNLGFTAPPFTFSCWFKTSSTSNSVLMSHNQAGSSTHRFTLLVIPSSGILRFQVQTIIAFNADVSGFTTGTWHHCAAVASSTSNRTAWLNGTDGTANTSSITVNAPNQFTAGRDHTAAGSTYCTGLLSRLAVWNIALNSTQIQQLAAGACPLSIAPSNLMLYVPTGLGSPEPDQSGNGRDLTLVNNPPIGSEGPSVSPCP